MVFQQDERYSRSSSVASSTPSLESAQTMRSPRMYPQPSEHACRQVFIKGLHGRTMVLQFEVPPCPWELVDRVADQTGLPAERLSLFFKGRRFNRTNTVLPNNATLHATINAYSIGSEDEDDDESRWPAYYDENASLRSYDMDELSKQARYAVYVKSMWTKKKANR